MSFYVSNKDESIPLYQNLFLERLTHVRPTTPLMVYVPIVMYFIYAGMSELTWFPAMMAFLLGVFFWSLLEYILHRFFFHHHFKSCLGKKFQFLSHGVHHDYPRDSTRLVMPVPVSLILAVIFYVLFRLVFGIYNEMICAGLITGYLIYDCLHYVTHHLPMKGKVGSYLKSYHLKHHYVDSKNGYGVSSPLWDYVFNTRFSASYADTLVQNPVYEPESKSPQSSY